ncbi:MAG TPA: NAD-dependent epimerase/dehydratase family protein [Verrucomicrobiae bacterium]|jgi:CDP-paratose 2-epimerase
MNRNERKLITVPRSKKPVLITGGAGFIGTNVAHRFLSAGQPVVLYDNLSRPGVEKNLEWLRREHGSLVDVIVADVRDAGTLRRVTRDVARVFHFAAQVAVTTSLENPTEDFEINARGTLNLLEALRAQSTPPPLLFTSTNKVYGHMADVQLRVRDGRYEPADTQLREHGFSEERCVHFHSPYGCSKGCAEQYVLDYAKTFNMPTVVFRMSCIYGLHQFGNEDQGWVAHFLIRALEEQGITIYGDGRQVRDVLFVEDLVDAMLLAHQNIGKLSGEVFNMGGGPQNTTSLLELLDSIKSLHGERPQVKFEDWRPADQQYYVTDTRKFSTATAWCAQVPVREGIQRLYEWLRDTRQPTRTPIVDVTHLVSRNGSAAAHARSTNGNGHGALKSAARSKRMYKLNGHEKETKLAKAV